MSIDWNAELLGPLYGEFGKAATLDAGRGLVSVTVIDKTEGIELFTHDIDRPSISPAATVRLSDLADLGIEEEDLIDGTLVIDGKKWTISNVHAKPVDGYGTGELMLILLDGDL